MPDTEPVVEQACIDGELSLGARPAEAEAICDCYFATTGRTDLLPMDAEEGSDAEQEHGRCRLLAASASNELYGPPEPVFEFPDEES
ncbi:MAG: hypothetical protein U5R31_13350 [Acidimicrobiia bacterium]|nr:hypothetical protein [Acidimicrobiia bacterium]